MTRRHVPLLIAAALFLSCHKVPPPPPPAPPPAPATPPPAPAPATPKAPAVDDYTRLQAMDLDSINRMGLLADVRFDYDKAELRDADRQILVKDSEVLRKYDFLTVTVEGHCDERGSVEYNLALGERRAKAAMDYLTSLGVGANRLKTVSYGKEAPLCQEHEETCWARNRRGHLVVSGKTAAAQ